MSYDKRKMKETEMNSLLKGKNQNMAFLLSWMKGKIWNF